MRGFLVCAGALLCMAPLPASAQIDKMPALSPEAIRTFIATMSEKTKPGGKLNDKKLVKYLNAHLFEGGFYKSNITFQVPGYDDQLRVVSFSKMEFIENVLSGRKTMRDYDSSIEVTDIDFEEGRDYALIKTMTREKGKMPTTAGYVPFEGTSDCEQKIAIDNTVPMVLSAECESTLTFLE